MVDQDGTNGTGFVAFIVPKKLVKAVKVGLEERRRGHRTAKIVPAPQYGTDYRRVPTSFEARDTEAVSGPDEADTFLKDLGVEDQVQRIVGTTCNAVANSIPDHQHSPLAAATAVWYQELSDKDRAECSKLLVCDIPKTYMIYGPLLLLQPSAWTDAAFNLPQEIQDTLCKTICARMPGVTHIAINAPINATLPSTDTASEEKVLNTVRTPSHLHPLFGYFGPIGTRPDPSSLDFEQAFWTHTKQNGITQIWAPRYTMFSRGNISEKARLLSLPSVSTCVAARGMSSTGDARGSAAVDLYAGIGYFAFSYLKAGIDVVLGWDINPWSIEGLRRGALANKWGVEVYGSGSENESIGASPQLKQTKLLGFLESNDMAASRVEALRHLLPPVRHVNCGLLPTSRGSWETAVRVLDPLMGGWIHVHENFATEEIQEKAEDVLQNFKRIVDRVDEEGSVGARRRREEVKLEGIDRIKSYAPGVMHCVVDIYRGPIVG